VTYRGLCAYHSSTSHEFSPLLGSAISGEREGKKGSKRERGEKER
jgi:hypothetical protein